MKVSDLVFTFIKSTNTTVFTVVGGGCMHLSDSLLKSGLQYVCNHHEQACAMAAEAYFRTSGTPGCILVTTGPGGTNALTGVLCAYQDSIPMIILSGQVQTHQLSKGTGCRQIGQQEFNIVDTVKTMTKYAVTVTDKNDILYHLQKAWHLAITGRPGPVWLDIPLDIQAAELGDKALKEYKDKAIKLSVLDFSKIQLLEKLIANSKRPIIVIGNGIKSSNTKPQLLDFIKRVNIPVMSGPHSAVDIVNTDNLLYAGRFGLLGQRYSNKLIQESDLVISLGSRLNPKMIGYNSKAFAPAAIKFIVDVDKYELKKLKLSNTTYKWNIDLASFFAITENVSYKGNWMWISYVQQECNKEIFVMKKHTELKNSVSTYVFCKKLEQRLSDDAIIVTSNGTAHVIPMKTIDLIAQQQMFSNEGTAPMGYGLPAAIGAYYGCKKPIVCIEGDGSIMMNLQELQTAVHYHIPLKIFILNNNGYLSIRLTQDSFFNKNHIGSDIHSGISFPVFKNIAAAFGIKYYYISDNSEIDKVLDKLYKNSELSIIEIFSDPNELHEPKVVAKGVDALTGKIIPGELTDMTQ